MAGDKVVYHLKNPYEAHTDRRIAAIYKPSNYCLSLIGGTLPAIALRVLLVMGAQVQLDGKVYLHLYEIARIIQTDQSYVGKGIAALLRYNLVARHKQGEYWLSPSLFQPLLIDY